LASAAADDLIYESPLRGGDHTYDSPLASAAADDLTYESPLTSAAADDHTYDTPIRAAPSAGEVTYDTPIREAASAGEVTYDTPIREAASAGEVTYDTPIRAAAPPSAAEGDRVIYTSREDAPSLDGDDDYISDDDDDLDLSDDEAEAPRPLTAREAWHAEIARNTRHATTPLGADYHGEEHNQHVPGHLPEEIAGFQMKGTHYADSAAEFGVEAEGGKLSRGGRALDSTKNRAMWAKDKDQRMNFAMDGAGGLYAANPMMEWARKADRTKKEGLRNNHSSLVGGADVAAAGTIKVADGAVQEVGDDSGHYRPGVAQTHQAVERFIGAGVMDEARSGVSLAAKGAGERPLQVSSTEFMAYTPEMQQARAAYARSGDKADLAAPEQLIRKAHAKKDAVHDELLRTRHRQE
jgi:hypothetical protein